MKFFIDSVTVERLVDPELKIRRRALAEIHSILVNNILIEADKQKNSQADNNELSIVNLPELTKQLIRWFQFDEITNANDVFDVLILIFSRNDFLQCITKTISVQRLKKEVAKIKCRVIPTESVEKLAHINGLLTDFDNGLLVDVGHELNSFLQVEKPSPKADNGLSDLFSKLDIASPCGEREGGEEKEEGYKEYWVNLEGGDLEIFNSLDAELLLFKETKDITNVIKFIRATIVDFPPEFYLQPPYILETLIDLVAKLDCVNAGEVFRIINFIINGLKDREREAKRRGVSFIPVKKYINKILQLLAQFFERTHDNFDKSNIEDRQEILNAVHLVLFDIANFIKETQNVCDIYLNDLMNMLAKSIRDFRTAYERGDKYALHYRVNYIIELYAINALVAVINVENISNYSTNNAWEYECELALLDWPLRMHQQIHGLITKNRQDVIAEDDDMKMLLYDITQSWSPIVKLFQKWHTMNNHEIISYGLACLDTIRIHKSIEFIELLIKTINKCSCSFHVDKEMAMKAEQIILRLLSNEVPEIRTKAYQLVRDNVQQKLSEEQDKLKEVDLCYVTGVPISVEIIAEILCFGYTDENEEIHKHSKLILFALLRAQLVFPNHWSQLLDVIKPILPLLAGLFSNDKDHKLGFFALDIFHEHSGFDRHELCLASVRFLFCTHAKAREIAKIRLFQYLFEGNDSTNAFIEIIPENFCILPRDQVRDLELLNASIGYSEETYENIRRVLQSNRHNDANVIKTVLLQLNSLMNSLRFAKMSHDDNLWTYFMLTLDMGFPNNAEIRQLVIKILYKWAIAVATFRIYLSNEPMVLKFLVQSLVYCQDDFSIKKPASMLLFLLAFSDYVVVTDQSISLPKFIKSLECPFRFNEHWDRSPFNQVSQLEVLYEAINEKNDHYDVQKTTLQHMRFTFAEAWLGNHKNAFSTSISNEKYYAECGSKTFKLPQELLLTEADNKLLIDTLPVNINKDCVQRLLTVNGVFPVRRAVRYIIAVLMLPNESVTEVAEQLETLIKIYSKYTEEQGQNQKEILNQSLELYKHIIPWLKNPTIANSFGRKTFFNVFNKSVLNNEPVYMKMLQLINTVVMMCKDRPSLSEMIIYSFNLNHKLHFSSHLVERLFRHLTDNILLEHNWTEISRLPVVRAIIQLINNLLRHMPVVLDEAYMNNIFHNLICATRCFMMTRSNDKQSYMNSHVVNEILATLETITFLQYNYKLMREDYSTLLLWITESTKSNKGLLWSIIGNLTRQKDSFIEFCEGFEFSMNFPVNDVLHKAICSVEWHQVHEQKALAYVVANFIDHSADANLNKKIYDPCVLAKTFVNKKQMNNDALGFVLKKMIANKVPETVDIIKRRRFVQKFINDINNLHVVAICFKEKELTEYVCDAAKEIGEVHLANLVMSMEHSVSEISNEIESKKLNFDILNLVLILISTPEGLEMFKKMLRFTNILENFVLVVFDGLNSKNPKEIIFHMDLLNALMNTQRSNSFNIFSEINDFKISESQYFTKIVSDVEGSKSKRSHTIYEKSIRHVVYPIDLLFLQAFHIFNSCDPIYTTDADNKHIIRASSFLFIKTALQKFDHVKAFASQINVKKAIVQKTIIFVASIHGNPYTEATKKNGVQQHTIKKLCLLLKALTEWNVPMEIEEIESDYRSLFFSIIPVHGWIVSESYLQNCFLNFIQMISPMKDARKCIMQEISTGLPLIKDIYKRAQAISTKPPHTPGNLALLENFVKTIEKYCNLIEVRLMLRTAKVFQTLELLYPQLQTRKTTWNDVIIIWLKFFQSYSRYDDSECSAGQISLLCRFVRIGNSLMKSHALKILRNFSLKSAIGYVVVMSEDFAETIDLIMSEPESYAEKLIVLQTLLNITSRSEQSVSKIKNSSLNRKLKEHISNMEDLVESIDTPEVNEIYNLSIMLKNALY